MRTFSAEASPFQGDCCGLGPCAWLGLRLAFCVDEDATASARQQNQFTPVAGAVTLRQIQIRPPVACLSLARAFAKAASSWRDGQTAPRATPGPRRRAPL